MTCKNCNGREWVCEDHSEIAWGKDTCCGGAGMPCPDCNPSASRDDTAVIAHHLAKQLKEGAK